MSLAWTDLAAAFALYLVLEGLMPFLTPAGMRRALGRFLALPDSQLRLAGFASMVSGAVLLWLVRS
jgi:uncharacterized protein YjeT (DUF2065 family)